MAGKIIRFEPNSAGIQELLKSSGIQAAVGEAAAAKAMRADRMSKVEGAKYGSAVHVGQKRSYANIFPTNKESAHDNYVNNTLEKVIR